jgi:spermidine synthase
MKSKPEWWQILLSYIFPLTIYKTKSPKNAVIEIGLENGKMVLNSEHANYSYGSLLNVFIAALKHFNIQLNKKKDVLILGNGGGSVARYLISINPDLRIDAVEHDEKIIQLSKEWFDIDHIKQLHLIQADAFDFLNHQTKKYDLILVDLFDDHQIPEKCHRWEFYHNLVNACNPSAEIVYNYAMHEIPLHVIPDKSLFKEVIQQKIYNNTMFYFRL